MLIADVPASIKPVVFQSTYSKLAKDSVFYKSKASLPPVLWQSSCSPAWIIEHCTWTTDPCQSPCSCKTLSEGICASSVDPVLIHALSRQWEPGLVWLNIPSDSRGEEKRTGLADGPVR